MDGLGLLCKNNGCLCERNLGTVHISRRSKIRSNHAGFLSQHGSKQNGKHSTVTRSKSSDKPDFIESVFGNLFGKKALEDPEPFGMRRMAATDFPEQFPATTTEFAEARPGDDEIVASFRPLLANTQLEFCGLRLAYDAQRDGWSAEAFHNGVDSFGAALVLARTEGGAVCGGYNPRGWIGLGEDRDAIAAFLFTWPTGDLSQPAIKLPKVGGGALAVLDKATSGPQFGAEGLTIALSEYSDRQQRATCRLGSYYAKRPDGERSLFAPSESIKGTQLTDLKVYVADGKGEEWALDGIVWKTSKE